MRDRGYSHGGLTRPSLCPLSSCPCPHGAQCSCEGRGMVTSGRCTNVGRSQVLLERGPPLLWSLHPGGVLPCSPAPWAGSLGWVGLLPGGGSGCFPSSSCGDWPGPLRGGVRGCNFPFGREEGSLRGAHAGWEG